MLARLDAFQAAYAGIGVFDFDMAVAKKVDFAKYFPGHTLWQSQHATQLCESIAM